ncbi:MAG TPA: hypothetical protein VLX90_11700 [Steroidobacteraceae bacterium]|nr:hypothetical protein [Steroidobacteraceae bacterium]
MRSFKLLPAELRHGNAYRSPIYLHEVAQRRAVQARKIAAT